MLTKRLKVHTSSMMFIISSRWIQKRGIFYLPFFVKGKVQSSVNIFTVTQFHHKKINVIQHYKHLHVLKDTLTINICVHWILFTLFQTPVEYITHFSWHICFKSIEVNSLHYSNCSIHINMLNYSDCSAYLQ